MKNKFIDINIDIYNLDEASILIKNALEKWWYNNYLSNLDANEFIPTIIESWQKRYINTSTTEEAIQKIKDSEPPKEIEIKLVIELLSLGDLKLEDEIDEVPLFRAFMTSEYGKFTLDTYVYNTSTNKFESLEIIDQESLEDEKVPVSTINDFFSFHQRLLQVSSKKIKLYTAQPEERIITWYTQGFIPKGSYLTNSYERAEYYFNPEENDIIEIFRIQENELIMTSDAFGAKEYITMKDVKI